MTKSVSKWTVWPNFLQRLLLGDPRPVTNEQRFHAWAITFTVIAGCGLLAYGIMFL